MRTDQQDGPRRDAQALTEGEIQGHAPTSATARLFMTEVGRGRNVMFLHGWTGDSGDWNGQLPLFESRYRTVAVDLRGHGRSEIMPPGSYMPDDYVADIEALIATEYPGEEFVIVGHSMGGADRCPSGRQAAGHGGRRGVHRWLAWLFRRDG